MKHGFFPRLAWDSIRKNRRTVLPYWITCVLCVSMFYLLRSLGENPFIRQMHGGSSTVMILGLGSIVIGVFSVIFLFYTNSFLIRRRKREFGLYSVLGMDRRSIGRIMLWETLITAGIALSAGLIIGIAVSKLGELMLTRMVRENVQHGFFVSGNGVLLTLVLFGIIFLLLLLDGIRQVRFSSVVGLLKSTQTSEKPPRANYVLALLGLALLGSAYWMAVTIRQPLAALLLFFAAVLLVILATYLLMIAGSVALCRMLQKRKSYYYRTAHFVSVSSMVYRMKRNGAGLASICILATMVLVMLSATSCLYFGSDDALNTRYPRELVLEVHLTDLDGAEEIMDAIRGMIDATSADAGIAPDHILDCRFNEIPGILEGHKAVLDEAEAEMNPLLYDKLVLFSFLDIADYNRSAADPVAIPEGRLMVYSPRFPVEEGELMLGDTEYSVVRAPDGFEYHSPSDVNVYPTVYLFTDRLAEAVAPLAALTDSAGFPRMMIRWLVAFDTNGSADQQTALLQALRNRAAEDPVMEKVRIYSFSSRAAERDDYYSSFGGFFFLGILLSVVFLSAAVIIIYYKQLSEGYEDLGRFDIMQKVGMTKQDIRKSVNSQMRTVFFFPLGLAIAHLCFAFPMIRKMLMLFNLNNTPLLLISAALSTAAFAVFYIVVYRVTAGVYFSLVSSGETGRTA